MSNNRKTAEIRQNTVNMIRITKRHETHQKSGLKGVKSLVGDQTSKDMGEMGKLGSEAGKIMAQELKKTRLIGGNIIVELQKIQLYLQDPICQSTENIRQNTNTLSNTSKPTKQG